MTEQKKVNELKGLTNEEAIKLQEMFGKNQLVAEKKECFFHKILEVLEEPMFLLLLVAAIIYFILGEPKDGAIMLVFVIGIISIDVIQEWKTDKTLKSLKNLSAPQVNVIRNGVENIINSEDLVPGDLMIINEGVKIPADGTVVKLNDLCVDESSLTGEALEVWKVLEDTQEGENQDYWKKNYCYAGTLVTQGSGIILVDKIGSETEYGKIGVNIVGAPNEQTPLQKQTGKLVKICAGIAAVLFALVSGITYLNLSDHIFKDRIIESILSGITLAMAMIPEEFPVILTVFLSMGAWRLAKKKSLVRKLPSVETLGAISVLCVDKTGTITMNKMTVTETLAFAKKDLEEINNKNKLEYSQSTKTNNDSKNNIDNNNGLQILKSLEKSKDNKRLLEIMGMACETEAYDPMEKAMVNHCKENNICKDHLFGGELISEYSFTNESKMMGHVWRREEGIVIASKGSPEKILEISDLTSGEREFVEKSIYEMSSRGLRVIAVGEMKVDNEENVPSTLEECKLQFLGLIGLEDPARDSIKEDIKACIKAGVRVVMITGDNGITASAIAKKVGIPHGDHIITGDDLNKMSDEELREKVKDVSIFSRVVPEHKMRIVKAFKENGEIVAMTGDGVNDAPALKYADIGIAMGKRGSEVSREAADLILLDDNFSTIVHTVEDGRRIYDNIRKAVGYVFVIHIPIAFASLLAPFLGIGASSLLLLPVHVVLLELVIDPTCSIILERQLAEKDIMNRKPRNPKESILTAKTLTKSLIQGLVLFAASFGTYYLYLKNNPDSASVARTMGLAIIMISNVLLVQVNSSNTEYAYKTFKNMIKDKVMWAANTATIAGLLVIVYTPLSKFLYLSPLSIKQLLTVIGTSIVAVMWYEIVKLVKNIQTQK
ncbi:cation-translocating P-type ATPase [Clostridium gasigenes]|uniref:Ca2+-transporting ATPase n=1 Tax=Clostridium gasigenes TaxID=94869 RepID=A0A1H0LQT2_9CLOT|nr:cation-translocating P-type ATPase [Clostridium gasigenes]SDO70619.1 Ca2+-transporting ATPase [Clostridium gasigenes]